MARKVKLFERSQLYKSLGIKLSPYQQRVVEAIVKGDRMPYSYRGEEYTHHGYTSMVLRHKARTKRKNY
jgi:hypothetical protein